MTQDSGPEDDRPRSGRRQRRPQTLDLQAKEIAGEKPEGAAPASGTPAADPAPVQDADAAAVPEADAAQSGPAEPAPGSHAAQAGSAEPEPAADAAQPSPSAGPAADTKEPGPAETPSREEPRAGGPGWRALLPMPVLTGAVGALAGALIVFFLLPRGGGEADPRVGQLTQEVATLSERIESLAARPLPAPAPDQSGLAERIDKLTAAIGESERRLAAVEQRPDPQAPDLSVVDRRTAEIEAMLQDLRAGLAELRGAAEKAPETAAQSLAKLSAQIGELETTITSLAAPTQQLPPLYALANALRSGQPFESELAAVRALVGEQANKLSALDAYAQRGLPRIEDLEQQFAALAPAILRGPEPGGNFFERLMTNVAGLVEVRRVGEPQGMSIGAIVARTETMLARRDLDGAIREVESLPADKQQSVSAWLEVAKLRRDSEAMVHELTEESLARAREAARQ